MNRCQHGQFAAPLQPSRIGLASTVAATGVLPRFEQFVCAGRSALRNANNATSRNGLDQGHDEKRSEFMPVVA